MIMLRKSQTPISTTQEVLTVEANKTYSVTGDESRDIKRVAVRKGQEVKEGQTLFFLEEMKDSTEAKTLQESIDTEEALSRGDFSKINEWNKEQIWKHGSLYQPDEVLERVLQAPFDAGVFADYLEKKYGDIYGINI